ncbi:MAG: hypothetical protein WCP74_13095 [Sphingobacteriia bacterium]
MKRSISIFILAIYLLGATDAYQLLKLPLFVHHFITHHQENPQLSLAGFIKIHYLDPVVIDDDYAQDMQLPFKTHETDSCFVSAVTMPLQKISIEAPSLPLPLITYSSIVQTRYYYQPMVNIFQPPKAVSLPLSA